MQKITTIDELRTAVEQTEHAMGIKSDNRIPIKERVWFIQCVAIESRKNPEPTHNGVANYIGDAYYLKDLQTACDVLTYQNESAC